MKKLTLLLALLMSGFAFCDTQITDLKVTPISPFGKVILEFKVSEIVEELPLVVTCTEKVSGKVYGAQSLTGDTVLRKTQSQYTLEWDMAKEGIRLDDKDVVFNVKVLAPYVVIDLSGGTSATSYPVTVLAAPPAGGWTDEYKTTKLVLRVIDSGSYKMNGTYDVTISQPFYMGVFEVTQKQYELVTGSKPASYRGDARPVEGVAWYTIRGSNNWPNDETVNNTSFMGKLRAKTGLSLDLPTEAQWEYACRAGTTSKYNNGGDTEADLKTLGRYYNNGGSSTQHAKVGSYTPNAWGLYDMHGNVWEWCLDWYGSSLSSGTDTKGPVSGSSRVYRGGSWHFNADLCTSSYRHNCDPSSAYSDGGIRLACTAGVSDTTSVSSMTSDAAECGPITMTSLPEGAEVSEYVQVDLPLLGAEALQLSLDDEVLFSSTEDLTTVWKPRALGEYTLVYTAGEETITRTVKVVDLVKYAVTATIVGDGAVTGLDDYMSDTEVTLTATPNEGAVFCGWDVASATTDTHTFTMPEEAVEVTAYFASATALDKYVAREKLLTPAQANQQTQDYIADNKLMSKDEAKQELLKADEVFTADEMKEMAFDTPVVEVKNDVIEIAISLQTAESLDAWQAMALQDATLEIDAQKGQVRVKVPKGDKKAAFYKFVVPNEQ